MKNEIKKLTPYQHLRLRTEMYFGSRSFHTQNVIGYENGQPKLEEISWVPAVFTAFREILDNALDEVVGHGHGNRIDVMYDPMTMIFSVEDNGRGIPIDWDDEHQTYKATMAMSELMAGRNFEERGETAGTNGIGASGVNFCSEFFIMDICRDGKRFVQEFREGDNEHIINEPKISSKKDKTGTKITFKLSTKVFPDLTLPEDFVRSRLTEIALSNPHIKIYFQGDHIKVKPRPEQTLFPNIKPISIEIKEEGFRSRFWIVSKAIERDDHSHTVVNNIPAFNGGVHMETFRRMFFGGVLTALEKESKRRKLSPNRSDIMEGLLVYNITNMLAPNFDSQSKTRLINEEVSTIMKKALEDEDLYKDVIKKNREWIEEVFQRCAERTMKKDASDIAKMSKKNLRNKVPGLMDANGKDRSKCILFLAEGDSAISGMGSCRDPEIHGGLALRGKVMNINGESPKKVLENKVLTEIMNSLGLIIGQKARRDELRYGKVYLATDMDPDGANIAALLVNFFYTYWPELFDKNFEPFINVFQTPFIIADKGKARKYWYGHNYKDFKPEDHSGWSITRAKGLGTLTEEDWEYSLANPVSTPIIDDGKMAESLDLIFNAKKADQRKEWIGL